MKKLYIILLLTAAVNLFSQDPFYYRIDRSKGLPSNTVFDVFQDSKGFMWFAGSFGLTRYNGENFEQFKTNHTSSNAGTGIHEDKLGRIWYCNFDGKIFYFQQGVINQLEQKSTVGFLHFAVIRNFLYAVENNEIAVYDIRSLKKKYCIPIRSDKVATTCSSDSAFYVVSDKLYVLKSPTNILTYKLPRALAENINGVLAQAQGAELILTTKFTDQVYVFRNGIFEVQTSSNKGFVQNISLNNEGYWFCTTNGIQAYSSAEADGNHLSKTYLMGNNVSDVLMDKAGHAWIATLDEGLRFVPDFNTLFVHTQTPPTSLALLKKNSILLGNALGELQMFDTKKLNIGAGLNKPVMHSVYMLYADSISDYMFSTTNTFNVWNKSAKLQHSVRLAVKSVVSIGSDYYAYAASGNCGVFKLGDKFSEWDAVFETYKTIDIDGMPFTYLLNDVRGKSVAFNKSNNSIYISTNQGLYVFDRLGIRELKFKNESLNVVKLVSLNNEILALAVGAKLYRIDSKNNVLSVATDVLLNGQRISNIKVLHNELFIFSAFSVFQLDLAAMKLNKVITVNTDFELNDIEKCDDCLIISTNKGFIITPEKPNLKFLKPVLVIDSVLVNAQKLNLKADLNLQADQNNLMVYFSHLYYNPENENYIQYKINDAPWVTIKDNRSALELKSLKYGTYKLQIKFGNTVVDSDLSELNFVLNKPFWLQWWFIVSMLLVLLVILYFFDRWRTARINKKSMEIIERIELEKAANQSKLKAIKSQMNPHFFYNALNTIQSFILENDKKQAVHYLSKFSNLTRSILEMSERDEITIAEEIKVLKLYLDIEKARFNDDFEYFISCDDVDAELLKMPTLLLQPYVENALKHGLLHKAGPKKLEISFIKINNQLSIVITDNGIGRTQSMELNAIRQSKHKSFATAATENRVKLINEYTGKKISLEIIDAVSDSGQAQGTTVVINMPID